MAVSLSISHSVREIKMKLSELGVNTGEAATRDRLVRRLMGEGWDVWTEFHYDDKASETLTFDVLARRNGEVRVYEIVSARAALPEERLAKISKAAEQNGWQFVLEEVAAAPSAQQLSALRTQLGALAQVTREVTAGHAQVQGALSVYALMVADQVITTLLDCVALENNWTGHELHSVARKLIDASKLTDKEFTELARIRSLRNQAAHSPLTMDLTPADLAGIKDFIGSLAVKLLPQMG